MTDYLDKIQSFAHEAAGFLLWLLVALIALIFILLSVGGDGVASDEDVAE